MRLQEYVPELSTDKITRVGHADLTIFAPDSLSEAQSALVKLSEGEERFDVDVTIPLGRLHSVSGIVIHNGTPVASVKVTIHPQQDTWYPNEWHTGAMTIEDGSYRFDLMPSGTYILEVEGEQRTGEPHRLTHEGAVKILVGDGDVTNANINLSSTPSYELTERQDKHSP